MDAAAAYMERMERLYAVDLAVAVDNSNDGSGGWGGKAGAPGGNGIARVNCQAVLAAVAVAVEEEEEEEEEGMVDCDGNRAANGNGGPVLHGDCKDSDKSATPRTLHWEDDNDNRRDSHRGGSGSSRARQVESS